MPIDRDTKDWIRNAADERAAKAGMRFDGERGQFVCDWIEGYCCLYQGSLAGQPLKLYEAQRDFVMRLFGWVRWSDEWDEWIRRFTHASLWKAKKNGKSPLAAAYNLYLLAGDNEPGQNVYMMAHDGQQARIAQMHAINMVEQSPALADDCKVNKTTLQIMHKPSKSVVQIVTGDDKRGADSKHGYNGSVTIDEMHVVTRPMMDAVGRAGISRKEPLQVSFSTAGTDPSSVGFERCQYGRQVNGGERDDPHFLHVEYAAPQNATAAEIDERLEEYGKAANPAWGILVKPSEFRADWQRSKAEPRKLATFMQERLDVWVGSVNPWLDVLGWDRGRREFTLEDLAGRECFLGLDLSRTQDMTAAPLVFPWPEEGPECFRIWPLFWLPEATARARDHLFPYRTWADAGHLSLTPGDVVDYGAVEDEVVATVTAHRLKLVKIGYDKTYAEELTQRLTNALGCERMAVSQSLMTLTALCKDFERRVSAGQIQHAGNAVMSWQVGHVKVWTDRNQNIRPVKPDPKGGKSIDGIMATIDAMACLSAEPATSFISPNPVFV
jgi:phage terminase large subunit-like protein